MRSSWSPSFALGRRVVPFVVFVVLLGIAAPVPPTHAAEEAPAPFLTRYPSLTGELRREPTSRVRLGVGFSPLALYGNRVGIALSPLQVHYLAPRWDLTLLDVTIAQSLAGGVKSTRHFYLRSAARYRIFESLSVGPVAGLEYVAFPKVPARLRRDLLTAQTEPFTSFGPVFGVTLSQLLRRGADGANGESAGAIRISQTFLRQTYPVLEPSADEWGYEFLEPEVAADPTRAVLQASYLFIIEFSLLF